MSNTLEIKNLSKYYKDFKLDHISLNIPSGMVMGLIGENGAGKSTLINSILGITKSEYQSLKYFGKDFKTNEKEIKEKIAVIFDSTHYNQKFTPRMIEKILRKVYTNWDSATYHQYLKKFNLPLDKRIEKFSRGMKMKMEFAIAFSHHAKFLILDEATSGLDPIVRDEVLSMIREFTEQEENTVLMSSHITSDLDKIADYIAFIHEGRLIFVESHEVINEEYGIISGGKSLMASLNEEDIVAYIKEPYYYSILIRNRAGLQKTFTDLDIRRPSIEEFMLFYIKGVK